MTWFATFRLPTIIYAILLAVSSLMVSNCSSPSSVDEIPAGELDTITPRPGKRLVFSTVDSRRVWSIDWCEADSTRYQTLLGPHWYLVSQSTGGRFGAVKARPFTGGQEVDSLYVIDIADRKQHFIAELPSNNGPATTLSPDGSKALVFTEPDGVLRIFDIESKASVPLADDAETAPKPIFSPDGRSVAYVRSGGGKRSLHVVGIDGSGDIRVADSLDSYGSIAWSPDGKMIVYARLQIPFRTDICVVKRDGTGRRTLSTGATNDSDPQWSPDGSTIAFSARVKSGGQGYLMVMKPDGTDRRRVTTTSVFMEHSIQWSPDSKQLLFTSIDHAAESGLRTLDLASGKLTVISNSTGGRAYWDYSTR